MYPIKSVGGGRIDKKCPKLPEFTQVNQVKAKSHKHTYFYFKY